MRTSRLSTTAAALSLLAAPVGGAIWSTRAWAGPPTPVAASSAWALDAPGDASFFDQPLLAYDVSSSTSYVAWTNSGSTAIEICIVPSGQTSCEGGAPVSLTDPLYTGINTPILTGLVVLTNGEVVVTGATGNDSVAWASPASGSTFFSGTSLQSGGHPISTTNSFYQQGDMVALGTTGVGILDGEANQFSAASYDARSAAPEKSADSSVNFSSPPQFTDGAPQIAAEAAPGGGGKVIVVSTGLDDNAASQTNPGCPSINDTGYGVRVSAIGSLNTVAAPKYKLLACSADAPVLTGVGSSGLGVVEQEGTGVAATGPDYQLDFRPFVASAAGGSFGPPSEIADVTTQTLGGIDALDATDDSGAGVYALWADNRGEVLDYSSDGGVVWGLPARTPVPSGDDATMAAIGSGAVQIAYVANPSGTGDQVFLQAADYSTLVQTSDKLTTKQVSGSSRGADLTITSGTTGETDTSKLSGSHASVATGTLTYGLFSSSTCGGASRLHSNVVAVSAGTVPPSSPITTALRPGKYYWMVSYSGDDDNKARSSSCGSEVLTVVAG